MKERRQSQRRACGLVGMDQRVYRYRSTLPDDGAIRQRLRELATERRRFGYRRLHRLLLREGRVLNRKKLYRFYKEEKLTVRKRGGRKRALGTRAPMTVPQGANQRWSVDFASDTLSDSRRFRVFCVIDDFTRECLATVVDNSITGERVAREMDNIAQRRGFPLLLVVSDNGTEFTSNVMLRWQQDQRVEWHYIAPGKPMQNGLVESFTGVSVMSVSTNTCSPATAMPGRSSKTGGLTTTPEDHTRALKDSHPWSLQPGPYRTIRKYR